MKGISAIIATILMLMITIALAGLAYTYIIGLWGGRTGVVLSVDPAGTSCVGDTIIVALRNDGSVDATGILITAYDSTGASQGTTNIDVDANSLNTGSIDRSTGAPIDTYTISATHTRGSATGTVICATVGV